MAYSISYLRRFVFVAVAFALGQAAVQAEVKLPSVFGDHMVLQQGQRLPVWGWAEPGESVTVSIAGQSHTTEADKNGAWNLRLKKSLKASKSPVAFTVKGSNTIDFKDVLVGEVWLCSGQSNMEWPVRSSDNADKEIANAKHPLFVTSRFRTARAPRKSEMSPPTVGWFAARRRWATSPPLGTFLRAIFRANLMCRSGSSAATGAAPASNRGPHRAVLGPCQP